VPRARDCAQPSASRRASRTSSCAAATTARTPPFPSRGGRRCVSPRSTRCARPQRHSVHGHAQPRAHAERPAPGTGRSRARGDEGRTARGALEAFEPQRGQCAAGARIRRVGVARAGERDVSARPFRVPADDSRSRGRSRSKGRTSCPRRERRIHSSLCPRHARTPDRSVAIHEPEACVIPVTFCGELACLDVLHLRQGVNDRRLLWQPWHASAKAEARIDRFQTASCVSPRFPPLRVSETVELCAVSAEGRLNSDEFGPAASISVQAGSRSDQPTGYAWHRTSTR